MLGFMSLSQVGKDHRPVRLDGSEKCGELLVSEAGVIPGLGKVSHQAVYRHLQLTAQLLGRR